MNMVIQEPVHNYECRVRYGDTDSGGVVYYANYLRYFEAARTEFMRKFIVSYRELEDMGFILPVTECKARYKAPALYDDLLQVETCLQDVKIYSCRFNYRIVRKENNKLLVKGYTVHATINREYKLAKFPDSLLEKLKSFSGSSGQQVVWP